MMCVMAKVRLNMPMVISMWVIGKEGYWAAWQGHLLFHTGDRYEGSYVQGERTGEGIYYHASGDKYVGNFKNGMQDGHGTITWANGAVYDGQWKDNQRNGYGVYKWNVGDSYEGEWKDNKFNGQGNSDSYRRYKIQRRFCKWSGRGERRAGR